MNQSLSHILPVSLGRDVGRKVDMTKKVIYHFVEMRTISVPSKCPTGSFNEMIAWLQDNINDSFTGREMPAQNSIVEKAATRDWEIVDITEEE
jgi:predicted DNA-binding transcriptional regulator AlpA